jgi:molybdopterin-guanine dinucleotide biosynthesis protein B
VKTAVFVGLSGSGKTTLLVRLTAELKRRGLRVAVIKRCSHGIQLNPKAKDTRLYLEAGADGSLAMGPGLLALTLRGEDQMDSLRAAEKYFSHMDLVLIEGGKRTAAPLKLEVVSRSGPDRRILAEDEAAALVADADIDSRLPVFRPHEIDRIADFLLDWK